MTSTERTVPAEESGPRWLSPDEQDAWRALVGVLILLPASLDAQLQRDSGISHFEYAVMSALSEAPQRTRCMSELADLANGSLSRLSHVVKRLERRGWVRREPRPEDGRYTNAILTGEGWDKVVESAPGHVEAVREMVFDVLSEEEVEQLRRIGQRIHLRLSPHGMMAQRHGQD
ncbi:MarR family winged helix-turn-helix transcriptional regulator [Phytoactinopolyspora endophytica]|uniref:MarR family winged helix-turn-helix transcriptional regulator n=1 Tax=Phytoactinopolyspora endophytica TaxID=1642495 RepID=UPI00101BEC65|nr:MarR family transcriptional regulator [Phytoactinopolyspora endophytica]